MNNYLGVGVDATITMAFHRMRTANPSLFSFHRLVNKVVYMVLGAKHTFKRAEPDHLNLPARLRVFVDDKLVPLPPKLAGLVVLNLPSFAGGMNLWQRMRKKLSSPSLASLVNDRGEELGPQSFNDGKLEVVGLTSPLTIGLAGVGVHTSLRLAQGSSLRLELLGPFDMDETSAAGSDQGEDTIAVQCDGEPWQTPRSGASISIGHAGMMAVLCPCKEGDRGSETRRTVAGVLQRARESGLLSEEQRTALAEAIAAELDSSSTAS